MSGLGLSLDRRKFLKAFGALFVGGLANPARAACLSGNTILATAFKNADLQYGLALFSACGKKLSEHPLPSRGHDVVFNGKGDLCVVFARRPGNFALAVKGAAGRDSILFHCPADRHFYGHGAFSKDGRLLFATENDFDQARGTIGIYDAWDRFSRIGEFETYGVGPHEVILNGEGNALVVANGGIETHPDFGRRKLNIASMQPSVVYIDLKTGDLLEKHQLNGNQSKLSIRHLAPGPDGTVLFACQNEAWFAGMADADNLPLVGSSTKGEGIALYDIPGLNWSRYRGYIGSISVSPDQRQFAISSPKGNAVTIFGLKRSALISHASIDHVSGLAHGRNRLHASSAAGHLGPVDQLSGRPPLQGSTQFENHLAIHAAS